jgi:hypothetical protein
MTIMHIAELRAFQRYQKCNKRPQFDRVRVWSQSKRNTYIWVIIVSCFTMGKAFGWGTFLQMLGGTRLFSHLRPLVWVHPSLWVALHLIWFVVMWDILNGEFFPLLVCFLAGSCLSRMFLFWQKFTKWWYIYIINFIFFQFGRNLFD